MKLKKKGIEPFLKWAGGKRQLLPEIEKLLTKDIRSMVYYEPFIGGGALLFHLRPAKAVINDLNPELVNTYRIIKEHPKELIAELLEHESKNNEEYFYHIRSLDRNPGLPTLTDIQRAARVIYLNKTCYNGLYRVNASGFMNTPYGRYKKPNIANTEVIEAVSEFLNESDILMLSADYEEVLRDLPPNAFVYLDPPYHPLSDSSSFTTYVKGGWTETDQLRLRDVCRSLDNRKIHFMLSNSSTDFIRDIYSEFNIHTVKATRMINSKGSGRSHVSELIIINYNPPETIFVHR